MATFYGQSDLPQRCRATARRQLTFSTKSPEIPSTHMIDLGRMNSRIDHGAT